MNKTATAPSDPVVQLQQAGKDYKKGREHITVLHDLDFSLHGGEMVSIMGPSGSGKSTLLNLISGVNVCDRGEVFLQGHSLHRLRPEERTSLRARHIGFVFQFYNLLPVLSAEENVALPCTFGIWTPNSAGNASTPRWSWFRWNTGAATCRMNSPEESANAWPLRVR